MNTQNKKILVIISVLGLAASLYGYYELLGIVPVFIDLLATFNSPLSPSTEFIFNTYKYYWLLSSLGLLALTLVIFNRANTLTSYVLVVSNVLIMFIVRWAVAHELQYSVSQMGLIQ